jgi:hypothetical protein
LIVCSKINLVVSLTRGGVGFWNLENGNLDNIVAETPSGGEKDFFNLNYLNYLVDDGDKNISVLK